MSLWRLADLVPDRTDKLQLQPPKCFRWLDQYISLTRVNKLEHGGMGDYIEHFLTSCYKYMDHGVLAASQKYNQATKGPRSPKQTIKLRKDK